ncbi:hypothetical protein HY478_02695 [Candidatus Uhrbacteria bacterium]|nr:hypothetical protein [Candidatus Uhrbacteria bacterium]
MTNATGGTKQQWGTVARAILGVLGVGALVVTAAVVPNAVHILGLLLSERAKTPKRNRSLEQAIRRLRERRLVEFVSKDGTMQLQITEAGRKRLRQFEFENMRLVLPARWDKQWMIVLFDIPEDKKSARDALQRKLREIGCFQFHKSVFVHPADCADEIDFVVETFLVSRYVTHFRTPSLGSQEYRVRRHFSLR